MSDTSKTEIPIEPIKKPKAVEEKSDIDLVKAEKIDVFWLKRIAKFSILILFVTFCFVCLFIFIKQLYCDRNLQLLVFHKIADNITVLLMTALTVFGVNISKN